MESNGLLVVDGVIDAGYRDEVQVSFWNVAAELAPSACDLAGKLSSTVSSTHSNMYSSSKCVDFLETDNSALAFIAPYI